MFTECTIQYDTKKWGDIYVFVETQILVFFLFFFQNTGHFMEIVSDRDNLH